MVTLNHILIIEIHHRGLTIINHSQINPGNSSCSPTMVSYCTYFLAAPTKIQELFPFFFKRWRIPIPLFSPMVSYGCVCVWTCVFPYFSPKWIHMAIFNHFNRQNESTWGLIHWNRGENPVNFQTNPYHFQVFLLGPLLVRSQPP